MTLDAPWDAREEVSVSGGRNSKSVGQTAQWRQCVVGGGRNREKTILTAAVSWSQQSSLEQNQNTHLENSAISSRWIFCRSLNSVGKYLVMSFSINTVLQYCLWARYWGTHTNTHIYEDTKTSTYVPDVHLPHMTQIFWQYFIHFKHQWPHRAITWQPPRSWFTVKVFLFSSWLLTWQVTTSNFSSNQLKTHGAPPLGGRILKAQWVKFLKEACVTAHSVFRPLSVLASLQSLHVL